jgi:hypothetical protein
MPRGVRDSLGAEPLSFSLDYNRGTDLAIGPEANKMSWALPVTRITFLKPFHYTCNSFSLTVEGRQEATVM